LDLLPEVPKLPMMRRVAQKKRRKMRRNFSSLQILWFVESIGSRSQREKRPMMMDRRKIKRMRRGKLKKRRMKNMKKRFPRIL
jgi:hypothetical protein